MPMSRWSTLSGLLMRLDTCDRSAGGRSVLPYEREGKPSSISGYRGFREFSFSADSRKTLSRQVPCRNNRLNRRCPSVSLMRGISNYHSYLTTAGKHDPLPRESWRKLRASLLRRKKKTTFLTDLSCQPARKKRSNVISAQQRWI